MFIYKNNSSNILKWNYYTKWIMVNGVPLFEFLERGAS
ncbi:hypothetical protein F3D3_1803 [Fusibacter sp. 3D3]|nr:hypothetical protein F3D3_1803 [Fusibacter sp. 3D3]